jgi:hypothetical protein
MRSPCQRTLPTIAIQVCFAAPTSFPVKVLAGSTTGRPASLHRNNHIFAPARGNILAGGHPSTGRNVLTKGQQ